jgi:hypothetical protein
VPRLRLPLAALLVLALAAPVAGAADAPRTYLRDAQGTALRHPASFAFSANGDLTASGLRWRGWGTRRATARGTFAFQERPAGTGTVTVVRGTLTVSRVVRCGGRRFYARASIAWDEPPPWRPRLVVTPC